MSVKQQSRARWGVIGGSGLYEMEGLRDAERVEVTTPFGAPSDAFVVGLLGDRPVAFLARHGKGHRILPTEINYRANIYGFKSLGVELLISASAVGSLDGGVEPLDVVVPDQFIDRTRHRCDTFFGEGLVGHVSLADPFCPELSRRLAESAERVGARVHRGGTYVCMEGPQFSTRAESELYRSWGAKVIGMTNLQEARLAREAELCFATLALVTDFDCWKADEDPVSVEAVIDRLHRNAALAAKAIGDLAAGLDDFRRSCPCAHALESAIITARDQISPEARQRLGVIVQRVLG